MGTVHLILIVLAAVLFACGVGLPPAFEGYRLRLIAGGLLAWALAVLLGGVGVGVR